MSCQHSQICKNLLHDYFGATVGSIGYYLLARGKRPLSDILIATGFSIEEVKQALFSMIKHNLVEFQASAGKCGVAEYMIIRENVYSLVRYPKYLCIIKLLYGTSEQILIETLLSRGKASASNVIFHSARWMQEANDDGDLHHSALHQSFQKLAQDNFIIRCPKLVENKMRKQVPTLEVEEKEQFMVPQLELDLVEKLLNDKPTEIGEHSDSEILWRVNCERFDVELRNELLVNAAARRVDVFAGELYKLILKFWDESSQLISVNEIKHTIESNEGSSPMLLQHFDQYLRVLYEDTSSFIIKVDGAGDDLIGVNYRQIFEVMACASLDSIVLERYGKFPARIFRMIRIRKSMTEDEIGKLGIPAKDISKYTWTLCENGFLEMEQVNSNRPCTSKNTYYKVDLPRVVRTELEASYKGLCSVMERQKHDLEINKPLMEKHESLVTELQRLRGDGVPEDELAVFASDYMSDSEKSLVGRLQSMSDNLTLGQNNADETILMLENYLKFESINLNDIGDESD